MKNVIWLSVKEGTPPRGYWDQFLLEQAFEGYNHAEKITDQKEAIVIIPGAYQGEYIDQINEELKKLERFVVIVTSDEENKFPVEKLQKMHYLGFGLLPSDIYVTYPTLSMPDYVKWLPIGYPPQLKVIQGFERHIDWSFAGQINHESRESMVRAIAGIVPNGHIEMSKGFSQGLKHGEYYELMGQSKVVLCPRGNVSPDSFRLYEALENGCVPIVENSAFWHRMFKHVPFPVVDSPNQWRVEAEDSIRNYKTRIQPIYDWWQKEKRRIFSELRSL